jgi:hypothetical protein
MADTNQLAIAICRLVQISDAPVPIKLANQTVEQAAAVIGAVVETCSREGVSLGQVCIDPELALELGLVGGGSVASRLSAYRSNRRGVGEGYSLQESAMRL